MECKFVCCFYHSSVHLQWVAIHWDINFWLWKHFLVEIYDRRSITKMLFDKKNSDAAIRGNLEKEVVLKNSCSQIWRVKFAVKILKKYLWGIQLLVKLQVAVKFAKNELLHRYFSSISTANSRTPIFQNTSHWLFLKITYNELWLAAALSEDSFQQFVPNHENHPLL